MSLPSLNVLPQPVLHSDAHPTPTIDAHAPQSHAPVGGTPGAEEVAKYGLDGGIFTEDTMTLTGSTKWDIFVIYIIFCVCFIAVCCLSILFMFWCCPARNADRMRGASIYWGASPTATRNNLRRLSSLRKLPPDGTIESALDGGGDGAASAADSGVEIPQSVREEV